jgi:hypothetical protein
MRGISWLAENRLASQEGLCSTEWVSNKLRSFQGMCIEPLEATVKQVIRKNYCCYQRCYVGMKIGLFQNNKTEELRLLRWNFLGLK